MCDIVLVFCFFLSSQKLQMREHGTNASDCSGTVAVRRADAGVDHTLRQAGCRDGDHWCG